MDCQVITVSKENRASYGADNQGTIIAFVNLDLTGHIEQMNSTVLQISDFEIIWENLAFTFNQSFALFGFKNKVLSIYFFWSHICTISFLGFK